MKPPAAAILENLVWSTDGGVWAVWRVEPFPHAHTAVADKLAAHGRVRGLLVSLPPDSMLLSVCERLEPMDVVGQMVEGVDLDERLAWRLTCEATLAWLEQVPLRRRRYYVAARLADTASSWQGSVRDAVRGFTAAFGLPPAPVSRDEAEQRQRQAAAIERRLAQHVPVARVTAGELCWLYARAVRRGDGEPSLDARWEPPAAGAGHGPDGPGRGQGVGGADPRPGRGAAGLGRVGRGRLRGVLAHLTDVLVWEGGTSEDEGRPRHRRYVRVDDGSRSSFQTVLAMADMPHYFDFPGGGGEWLFHVDQVGFPVDWCVRVHSVPNAQAQAKVRRKHRDLVGQIGEYDGEATGAPPQLAEAIRAIDTERSELGANPAEAELQATILLSIAASTLTELEDHAGALTAMFEPQEYGLARPTGGQAALLRSMLPATAPAPVCRDYTQYMLARDLAAGSPFCGTEVGDPAGLLLGVSLDGGCGTPVLFDPAFGPRVNTSPSLAAVGRLGSGKSYFLKRLCWDTIARGGQVVTIDRTTSGEYVDFARAIPDRVQIVRLEAGADICLDPLRTFTGELRDTATLGFLSLLAGCSAQSEEGAALAEAVDTVTGRPDSRLDDVLTELERIAARPDPAARAVARRLAHYRRSATGQLVFGTGRSLTLDADLIVFWTPNLSLPDRATLESEHRSRTMLPEQILGQALLYLVAAVGRQVVFRDPTRFAAALYDEAWALLASPHGQNLLIEGVRDGRKHNGAIWLASQHPNDLAVSELHDLLGARFVFRQARTAIPAALRLLGTADDADAAQTLQQGLDNGQCLYRDVRERTGLIQILPPALPHIEPALETTPRATTATAPGDVAGAPPPIGLPGGGAAGGAGRPLPGGGGSAGSRELPEAPAARGPRGELVAGDPPRAVAVAVADDVGHRAAAEGREAGREPGENGDVEDPAGPEPRDAASEARKRARRRRRAPLAQILAGPGGR